MKRVNRKKRVLFICAHNSARSKLAEGLLKALYGNRYEAYSAGTESLRVNPCAIRVMSEIGIDISGSRSKSVDEFNRMKFDYVVTVCDKAKETCSFFPGGQKYLHRAFEDPAKFNGSECEKLVVFRRIRDEIGGWIEKTFGEEYK